MTQPSAPVVWLQPAAPPKPAEGAPCNGCGLCCLAEPCPLGVLVSRRRRGACVALRWSDRDQRYWCGMVAEPASVTGWRHPWVVRGLSLLATLALLPCSLWLLAQADLTSQLLGFVLEKR